MTKILNTIKKMIGLDASYIAYDIDILININSVISTLYQMGVVDADPYVVVDQNTEWDDLDLEDNVLQMVKEYIYFKVKNVFDPPASNAIMQSYENKIKELEYRMYAEVTYVIEEDEQ